MTDHRRYSQPTGPGNSMPNQRGGAGYPQAPGQAGHQQPYDWRYATQAPPAQPTQQFRQPYDPYRGVGPHGPVGGPPVGGPVGPTVIPAPPRRRSRAGALFAGALVIAVVSAGVGGSVVMLAHPDKQPVATVTAVGPAGPTNVPAAILPAGSVEQVAAKVVPSDVQLATELGRQPEDATGLI